MLKMLLNSGGEVKSWGGCSQARGIDQLEFSDGVKLSNMKEFARWTVECDKVLSFQNGNFLIVVNLIYR
jgi:uncharacterized protein involved in oxidation of intracellular sulfur